MPDNLFNPVSDNLPEELFETLLQHNNVRIERIVSKGHTTPEGEWYDQSTDEWVILLQGSATLLYRNGQSVDLCSGDYLWLPAHLQHRVEHTSENPPTLWLAIHIAACPEPAL